MLYYNLNKFIYIYTYLLAGTSKCYIDVACISSGDCGKREPFLRALRCLVQLEFQR